MLRVRLLAAVLFSVVATTAHAAQDVHQLAGHWIGSIHLTAGQMLAIDVDLRQHDDKSWDGDITIPAQNAKDLALDDVRIDGDHATFVIHGIAGKPTFDGRLEGANKLAGDFTQAGQDFTFELARGGALGEGAKKALAGFEDFVEQARIGWQVPGVALAIVADGEVVLSKGFGLRDTTKKLPVTTHTLFAIGSSTKAFTTFTMGTLVDEGRLDWNQPATRYLPTLKFFERETTEHITLRDLVTHRCGLPRHDLVWYNSDATRAELVKRLEFLQPVAELRAEWNYNNLMFLTAGYLIEQVTGKSWEDNVRARVFEPLGMQSSNFSVLESQKSADFALPYQRKDDAIATMPFRDITTVGPAGSINSNIEDMTRWVRVQLDAGRAGAKQVISAATLAELHTPQMVIGAKPERKELGPQSYAMAWFVEPYRGHMRLEHGGNIDGFSALVTFLPDDHIGLVVLTNLNGNGLPEVLVRHALDRMLGLEAIDWNGELLAKRKAAFDATKEAEKQQTTVRKPGTKPAHELAEYAGDFANPGYGKLKIELKDGALIATYNHITAPLEHWHYEVFNGAPKEGDDQTLEDTKFMFVTDLRGDVSAVQAEFEPRVKAIEFTRQADARMSDPTFLANFTGDYEFTGQVGRIELSGSTLRLIVPGQPTYDLVPQTLDAFTLDGYNAIRIRFSRDPSGAVNGLTSEQPNGVFSAKRR